MTTALRTKDVTAFHEHAVFTGVTSKDRAGWLGLRKTMLTASDVASVLNLDDSPKQFRRSAIAVYAEKLMPPEPDYIDLDAVSVARLSPVERAEHLRRLFNDARFWGSRLEQPILTTVAEFSGWRYREGGALLRSAKHPWLGCTLDAEIDRGEGLGWSDCEGKTTTLTKEWDEDSGALPTHVLIQAQSQLLVTGAPVAIVVALLQGCRLVQIPVEPDERFHAVIVEEGEAFMERVRSIDPPPPDWRESSTHALSRLYGDDDGSVVDLPPVCVAWTRELNELAERMKMAERRHTEIRNLLKHKIGPAEFGVLAERVEDRAGWRWKKNKAGQRVLSMLKLAPFGARPYGRNGAAVANDPLTTALEESLADDGTAPKIRYATHGKKRRSRR